MKVAVIGGGGREHALVWKLKQSPSVETVYAIPGSAAMAEFARCVPLPLGDLEGITDYAAEQAVDLLVCKVFVLVVCKELSLFLKLFYIINAVGDFFFCNLRIVCIF